MTGNPHACHSECGAPVWCRAGPHQRSVRTNNQKYPRNLRLITTDNLHQPTQSPAQATQILEGSINATFFTNGYSTTTDALFKSNEINVKCSLFLDREIRF